MKKSWKLLAVAAAAAVLTSATAVMAQERGAKRSDIKTLDTNRDKMISRAEAAAAPKTAQNFDKIDANKDGQLSREEMKAFRRANKPDQDGDGNISRAEAASKPHLAKSFDRIDTNKDGVLTPAERQAAMQSQKPKRP